MSTGPASQLLYPMPPGGLPRAQAARGSYDINLGYYVTSLKFYHSTAPTHIKRQVTSRAWSLLIPTQLRMKTKYANLFDNIVITWLFQSCWNNLVTSLIVLSSLLRIVNSLFLTCSNNLDFGAGGANTTCWRLVNRLKLRSVCRFVLTCAFLRMYPKKLVSTSSV